MPNTDVRSSVLFEIILVRLGFTSYLCKWQKLTAAQAANYLDIKALLDVGCSTVANMIKGKSPEEIRKTSTFRTISHQKKKTIRRENEWAAE